MMSCTCKFNPTQTFFMASFDWPFKERLHEIDIDWVTEIIINDPDKKIGSLVTMVAVPLFLGGGAKKFGSKRWDEARKIFSFRGDLNSRGVPEI